MALIQAPDGSWQDTNDQSGRATLRQQGYYIDPSGVYAPGSGQNVGQTFSGSQSGQNTTPSGTQLPIINGTPVSPSNGSTGPQTAAIMYRSDPLYSTYFGPGTPGYSSTSRTYNATPTGPEQGQQSLTGYLSAQGTPVGPNGAPMPKPATSLPPAPGVTDSSQAPQNGPAPAVPPAAAETNATANAAWQAGIVAPNPGGGFGPYATAEAPLLEDQGQYAENGQIIKKQVDQYGNSYFQTVGPAPSAPTPTNPAPANPPPTTPPDTGGPQPRTLVGPDGKPYSASMTDADYAAALQDLQNAQAANRQAILFQQGLDQGKLSLDQANAAWQKAYQQQIVDTGNRNLALTAARDAMQNDIQQQTLALNKQAQANQVAYQNAQLEQTRQASAQTLGLEQQRLADARSQAGQTNSLEQDKLSLARQQLRGRRLPQVRFA